MSDFLTNLVMRSFSGAPSVQPSVQPIPHSTYAPPEALPEQQPVNKPSAREIPSTSVKTFTEPNQPATQVGPVVFPEIQTEAFVPETFESEQSVFPSIERLSTPKPEIKTETQPAQLIFQTPIERITPTISSPAQPIERETVSEPKHEVEIVEHVIEREVMRPTTREIMRPVTRHITRPVTRHLRTDNTIENTTEKTIEHTTENTHRIENTHTIQNRQTIENTRTIENTQHEQQVTSSFTTLIPNTPPRLIPTLKSRPHTPVPDLPSDAAEQPAPQPETVINVAIGRIEVRATPPSTPKRERQQNGPKIMTLDDYVQKRSRGAQ